MRRSYGRFRGIRRLRSRPFGATLGFGGPACLGGKLSGSDTVAEQTRGNPSVLLAFGSGEYLIETLASGPVGGL